MPFVYILKCADGSFYTGSTWNIDQRMAEHQSGSGSNHTKVRLPVELVFCEEYDRMDEAYARERQIHGWNHLKKQALIDGDFEKLKQLSKNHSKA